MTDGRVTDGRATETRAAAKRAFLDAAGWGGARLSPLAGDASNRRYERVAGGPGGAAAVLMDAPAERGEDIRPFLAVAAHLGDLGFSAPEVFEADAGTGFALIEDLGDDLFARVAADAPAREAEIYAAAVDCLVALRAAPPASVGWRSVEVAIGPYDEAVLVREASLAIDWWAPHAGARLPADAAAEFAGLIAAATAGAERGAGGVLTLRDYHAENLLWLPGRDGLRRVGMLDFQDALAGAPAYDLVSLLEDARRDTGAALREAMIARYVAGAGFAAADAAAFRESYAALGAQRNLKIVGIFARLCVRDGKPAYPAMIPRVWGHLDRDLAHPALAPLRRFVERWIPAPTADALSRVRAAA